MTTKSAKELLNSTLDLLDQFELDCTDDELKSNKDAKKCFKKLKRLNKETTKYCNFLSKQEVIYNMRKNEKNDKFVWAGLILAALCLVVIIGCGIASIVISVKNPDMTEMRRLVEYPQPAIIGCIALVGMFVSKFLIEWGE